MSDSSTQPKPSVKDGPVLREHSFDGIQEYDQKLPNWWLFTFYIAIVLFVGTWVYYFTIGGLQSPKEKINATMAAIQEKKEANLRAMLSKLDDNVLVEWSKNETIVAEGEEIYNTTCMACHSPTLEGGIGRSLVDAEWEYGGKPMEIFQIIINGSPADAKGFNGQKMQPFGDLLGAEKVAKVTAYITRKSPSVEIPPES